MKRKLYGAIAVAFAASMTLTACNSGGSASSGESSATSTAIANADPKAVITVNGVEPQNPLVPTMTNETGGGRVVNMLNAGLVYYEPETGEAKNELADSIEPNDDGSVWTIKIKDGVVFSDGTPITSDSFIKAWNYGANPKNANLGSSFFEIIKGYTAPPEEDGATAPDVPELSGLKKVDDKTFTVTLNSPTSDFKQRLGYSSYAPLPEVAFNDVEAYGDNPTVTSGPYKMKDGGWQHNTSIEIEKNDKYQGPQEAKNGGVLYKIYTQPDAAYADLSSGQIDVVDQIGEANLASYRNDYPDSSVDQPVAVFQSFTIPGNLEHFKEDEEGKLRRQAISMAINREEICKTIFHGTKTPAVDFTSPSLPNYDAVQKLLTGSSVTKFDVDKAKELWAKADAISKFDGKFTIGYNNDGGHKGWVDAVANQLKNNLGIDAEGNPYPDFKGLRDEIVKQTIKGAFRSGWQADYPGMTNFLEPLYSTNGGSNDGKYSNAKFDNLLVEINKTTDQDQQNKLFAEAQDILFEDLPAIPIWYSTVNGAWNKNKVGSVQFNWQSQIVYYKVTKAAS